MSKHEKGVEHLGPSVSNTKKAEPRPDIEHFAPGLSNPYHRYPVAVNPQRDAKAFPPVSILYRVAQHEWVILGIVPKLRQIVLARTNALKPGGFVLCKDRGKKFVG